MDTLTGLISSPQRIRVFRSSERAGDLLDIHDEARVFVTIGAGETHVTILDDEGVCDKSWTAVFGWSFLFGVPVDFGGRRITFEEQETVALALQGSARIYGQTIDTTAYVRDAGRALSAALDDILYQTVGSGARFLCIVLAAPEWLHGLLSGSVGIRPHILHEIRDI
ncbi:hypothetical protein [Defluviimonas salinarum]|uniref:Uncharacterized protein n=1 Tax=Defluviimonas salinarum TaxID=2992147 RepID=A0ABT3J4G7_9RHOB|nr:hypothetical protein [Defluviimonas salinarum]MCW3782585.1 hypothetical protein [Defluviimonas salinarum]